MKYFIGNWKMFGVPKSVNILNKINSYYSRDKNRNKYKVIITPPYTLIESYSKYFKNYFDKSTHHPDVSNYLYYGVTTWITKARQTN